MSCIYKCDRCGKIINASEFIREIPNGEPEDSEEQLKYVGAHRITLLDGSKKCDLCLKCKMELYDWMFDKWSID